jgi:type IV secretory pathway protease TraF
MSSAHTHQIVGRKRTRVPPLHLNIAFGRRWWVMATAAGVLTGALSLVSSPPRLVWNFSPSVPLGLYGLHNRAANKGDLVAIAPSGALRETLAAFTALPPGRLLLKKIAATAGDAVCREGTVVTVNGRIVARALDRTSSGERLPTWTGCATLTRGQIFALAPNPASFDGRYFGPSATAQVAGVLSPVFLISAGGDAQ